MNAGMRFPFLCVHLASANLQVQTSTSHSECGAISFNRRLMSPYLWCVNLVLKGQGANSQRPALERPVVQEGGGLRVCGAERSHPRALVASGAV